MKILMTLMGLDIGGAETHVVELSRALCRRGHTVIVASNGGVYEEALSREGIAHVKIPMHRRSIGCMLRSLRLLRALIRRENPDLVHAHARIPAFLCGILRKTMKFPFITSAHGVFAVTPALKLMTNWGERTVAVSEDIKAYLLQEYRCPEDQIHVTINGIDTEVYASAPADELLRQELGLGSGPVVCLVGRLDEASVRLAQVLLSVCDELIRRYADVQVLIVGGGSRENTLCAEAERINKRHGRNTVVMTGPRTDVARLLPLSTVFVGVSRSALEAMAAERPVILAGNPDYQQGYMGIFGEAALESARKTNFCCRGYGAVTPEKLLEDLTAVLDMPSAERQALGRYGRQVVQDYYSVARMTEDYLKAYEKLLDPPRVIRAAVSGYYGYGNLGDDAILHAIARQLYSPERPVRLTVLSRHPGETEQQYCLPAVQRFSPWGVWRTLKRSDVLISGGGSLLQDKTSTRSLLYYLAVIRLAKLMKKPVFLYANGIGPLTQNRNRRMVRRCIERCDRITLRDQESLTELRSLGVTRKDIEITGDPVFTMQVDAAASAPLSELGVPAGAAVVGISVRRLPQEERFVGQFAKLCDRLVLEQGKTVVFLVMQESGDEETCQRIRREMTQTSYLAKAPGEPEKMLAMIRDMEMVISMRLHTLIFAAAVNVPVVGCVYDPKVSAMLGMLEMPSCGTPETMTAEDAYAIVGNMLDHLPEYKIRLGKNVDARTAMAEKNSRLFHQLMDNL